MIERSEYKRQQQRPSEDFRESLRMGRRFPIAAKVEV